MIATSIIISAVYTVIATAAFIKGYKMAERSTSSITLTNYSLLATVVRMLTAAMVALLTLLLLEERKERITFAIIFLSFYLVMLLFDVWFFIRSQKKGVN